MYLKSIAVALSAAAASAAAFAITANGQSSAPAPLKFTAKAISGKPVDLGRKGVSIGDEFLERGILKNEAGKAGGFEMVTQLVAGSPRHGHEHTTFVLELSGGQLVVTGGHATTSRFTMPLVGGTGSYRGARGTMTIAPGAGETERLTVSLDG